MANYAFDKKVSRKGTASVKWEFMPPVEGKDRDELLPLWIADMDFPCADPILEALHNRVDQKIFGYTSPQSPDYLDAVRGWFKRNFKWEFEREDIHHAPGVVPSLAILVRALTDPGDGVIIQQPVYYPFKRLVEKNGRNIVNNPLVEKDGSYSIDFVDLEEKASQATTRMMILCSPHNPVGRVWTKDELQQIASICLKYDVIIVSDEIHCDLVRKGVTHFPLSTLNSDDRIITCTAASKTFNIAGLQTSNIIIKNKGFREKWTREIADKACLFGANPLGLVATEAAYTEGDLWLEEVKDYIDDNLRFIRDYLNKNLPQAKYNLPEGTYFAWIDLRAYGLEALALEAKMQKQAGLLLDEGYIFGKEGSGFERINVACPRSILVDCMNRMKEVLLKNR